MILSIALWTSSNTKNLTSFIKALAIAILCFCPPLTLFPLSPTNVLYPLGNSDLSLTKLDIFANLHTCSNCSCVYSDTPYVILSYIVPLYSAGSWATNPICFLNHDILKSLISIPSILIAPSTGS